MHSYRDLPRPARIIAEASDEAVTAAVARDLPAFREAVARLAALDPEQVGTVLGAVVRSLLEDLHPDGLTADDVRAALERCVRSAREWCPDTDPDIVLGLFAGALGVYPSGDELPPPSGAAVGWHAPLLVADLVALSGRGFEAHLRAAFAEIARAETVELP